MEPLPPEFAEIVAREQEPPTADSSLPPSPPSDTVEVGSGQVRAPALRSRLTVVEQISYQGGCDPGVAYRYQRSLALRTEDSPLFRRLVVGPNWTQLDLGGIDEPILVRLENEEGEDQRVIPTDDERAAIAARIVEVGVRTDPFFRLGDPAVAASVAPLALAPPGESLRFQPHPDTVSRLTVRCQSGTARCRLLVVAS